MPKRAYPFEETFSPQAKIHVGEKELGNGVMKKEKMKAVYDRTLNLLFSGAKNVMNNNVMDTGGMSQATCHTDTNLHQLVLTSHGTLAKSCITTKRHSPELQVASACVGCQRVSSSPRLSCSYCECKLCDVCLRTCYFCGGSFCPKCSLLVYLQEEKVICLSCC